jgi:hypothetical protein
MHAWHVVECRHAPNSMKRFDIAPSNGHLRLLPQRDASPTQNNPSACHNTRRLALFYRCHRCNASTAVPVDPPALDAPMQTNIPVLIIDRSQGAAGRNASRTRSSSLRRSQRVQSSLERCCRWFFLKDRFDQFLRQIEGRQRVAARSGELIHGARTSSGLDGLKWIVIRLAAGPTRRPTDGGSLRSARRVRIPERMASC